MRWPGCLGTVRPVGLAPRGRQQGRKTVGIWTVSDKKRTFSHVLGPFRARKWPFPGGSGQVVPGFREQIRTFRATVGVFLPFPSLRPSKMRARRVAGGGAVRALFGALYRSNPE